MKNILVAVDGSENAERALKKAKEIGTAFKSKITILHVVEEAFPSAKNMSKGDISKKNELEKNIKGTSKKALDAYMEKFEDYDGEVETLIKSGKPGNEIIKVSEEGYDLLIIGSRGLGAFSRAMMGSVSNKVVNHVKTPVLVIK